MIEQSERLMILADRSKFEAIASFDVCPLSRIDTRVCGAPPPQRIVEQLAESGGRLIVAIAPEG